MRPVPRSWSGQTGPTAKARPSGGSSEARPLDPDESLVVIDADNRVPRQLAGATVR